MNLNISMSMLSFNDVENILRSNIVCKTTQKKYCDVASHLMGICGTDYFNPNLVRCFTTQILDAIKDNSSEASVRYQKLYLLAVKKLCLLTNVKFPIKLEEHLKDVYSILRSFEDLDNRLNPLYTDSSKCVSCRTWYIKSSYIVGRKRYRSCSKCRDRSKRNYVPVKQKKHVKKL